MICRGMFVESTMLFVRGGHFVTDVTLEDFPTAQPWLKWRLQRESLNLYTSKERVARTLGMDIAARTREGLPVDHLRKTLANNHRYVRAYERALASAGMLGAVERIIKTERFQQQYGYQDQAS